MILILSYMLLAFTQFVIDVDFRYNIGWFIIAISLTSIAINYLFLVGNIVLTVIELISRFLKKRMSKVKLNV